MTKMITLVAMYDDVDLQAKISDLFLLGTQLANKLGINLSDIYTSFSGDEKGQESVSSQQSIDHISKTLELRTYDILSFQSNDKSNPDKWVTRFQIEISDVHPRDHYQYIALYIDALLFEGVVKDNIQFIYEIYQHLIQYGSIDYSYLTELDYFSCTTFVKGIITQDLKPEDKMDIILWHNNLSMRKTFIRGVYLGNYLGAGHLANIGDQDEFIDRLASIVSNKNIKRIGEASLFFKIPKNNYKNCRNKVMSLFKEYDLLITPYNALLNVNDLLESVK